MEARVSGTYTDKSVQYDQGRCNLFQCFSPYDNTRVSTGREELFLTNCRPVYFVSVRCYVAVVSVSVDVQYGHVPLLCWLVCRQ